MSRSIRTALAWNEYERAEDRRDEMASIFDRKIAPLLERINRLEAQVNHLASGRKKKIMGRCQECDRTIYCKNRCRLHYVQWRRAIRRGLRRAA